MGEEFNSIDNYKIKMKRSYFARKPTVPLKRSPFKRSYKQMRRTKIRVVGVSDTAEDKKEIQRLVRLIVTIRDGGCILRKYRCGVEASVIDEVVVADTTIQADHLVTRSNGATYADTRLIVCVCKGCHGWKKWHEKEYEALVRTLLPKQRVELWDRAEADHQAHKTRKMDWKLEILGLKQELKQWTT